MKKNKIKKKSLQVIIKYECKSDHGLCPICVREAITEYEKNCMKEYQIENLKVKEIK